MRRRSRRGWELAESVAYSLREREYEVFLDRDELPPGQNYDQRIEDGIRQSNVFIFLISPESVEEGRYTLTEFQSSSASIRDHDS